MRVSVLVATATMAVLGLCAAPAHGVTHTLSVTVTGGGSGYVSSDPPGISCIGGTCSHEFDEGTSVALQAQVFVESAFAGWENCPQPNGTLCEVVMDGDHSVTARIVSQPLYQPGPVLAPPSQAPGPSLRTLLKRCRRKATPEARRRCVRAAKRRFQRA